MNEEKIKERKINKKSHITLHTSNNKGITLVALIITIIVLLILAVVAIRAVQGDGIISHAKNARDEYEKAQTNEQAKLEEYLGQIESNIPDGATKIPEGLEIGKEVTYTPSGEYIWKAKYCSITNKNDVTLKSSEDSFKISKWKVLKIDEKTGEVLLVPSVPTAGTVYLGQAQGYNNGVKLLNDACSELYGNSSKNIIARSINIEDIEKYMTDTAVAEAHAYINTSSNTTYGNQVISAYSKSNSYYPTIYAQEIKSVIDVTEKTSGLGISEQNTFIERTDNSATDGKLQATTSIQPYQTFWYKDATYMQTAFKDSYYNLIIPSGASTTYWVASRCVTAGASKCSFGVRIVSSGFLGIGNMYDSHDNPDSGLRPLFPVVSLSSKLITGDKTSGFKVEQ